MAACVRLHVYKAVICITPLPFPPLPPQAWYVPCSRLPFSVFTCLPGGSSAACMLPHAYLTVTPAKPLPFAHACPRSGLVRAHV